jgi:hypothetical protein
MWDLQIELLSRNHYITSYKVIEKSSQARSSIVVWYSTVSLIHPAVIEPVPFAKIFDINGVGMI